MNKILEKEELDPLRVYKRGWFLVDRNVPGFGDYHDIFRVTKDDVTENAAFQALVKALEKMVNQGGVLEKQLDTMISSPTDTLNNVRNTLDASGTIGCKKLQEELLRYVSVVIECIKKSNESLIVMDDGGLSTVTRTNIPENTLPQAASVNTTPPRKVLTLGHHPHLKMEPLLQQIKEHLVVVMIVIPHPEMEPLLQRIKEGNLVIYLDSQLYFNLWRMKMR